MGRLNSRHKSFLAEDQIINIPTLGVGHVHQLIVKLANLYWSGYGPRSGNGDWPAKVSKVTKDSWDGVDRGLFEALRTLRSNIAGKKKIPRLFDILTE